MDPGRKDTFGLVEMKSLKASLHATDTSVDYLNPTTVTTAMPIPQRQKVKAKDMVSVGEEDEESGEGQSLIPVENQVPAQKNKSDDN
jgi:hypothetical protein